MSFYIRVLSIFRIWVSICQRSGNQPLEGQLYFIGEETAVQSTSSKICVCLLSATVTVSDSVGLRVGPEILLFQTSCQIRAIVLAQIKDWNPDSCNLVLSTHLTACGQFR